MKIYRVKSETNPKQSYLVRYFELTNKFACECKKYIFSKTGYECKHILKVKKFLEKQDSLNNLNK